MAFILEGHAMIAGVPTDGLTCVAYLESRFSGVPGLGSPVPDANPPDAGPVLSSSTSGGVGHYQLTVPDASNYYVGCYVGGSSLIAWEGTKMATPHTSQVGWTSSSVNLASTRQPVAAAFTGSGQSLPALTLTVVSTAGFATSGTLIIIQPGPVYQVVSYTGLTATTFTGCTGGTGSLTSATAMQGYQAANARRLIIYSVNISSGSARTAVTGYATVAGGVQLIGSIGYPTAQPQVGSWTMFSTITLPVDPFGYYGFYPANTGGGTITGSAWTEVDF